MRTKTSLILLVGAALGAATTQRVLSRMGRSALAGGLKLAGYVPWPTPKQMAHEDLLKLRGAHEDRSASEGSRRLVRMIERTKAKYDEYTAGSRDNEQSHGSRRKDGRGPDELEQQTSGVLRN